MANRLDKPFQVGDRVEVNEKGATHYPVLMRFKQGRIESIPQERWHFNEVVVKWDSPTPSRERSALACWALDKVTSKPD